MWALHRVSEFEAAPASWLGVRSVVAVNSGTSALQLALRLAGVGHGGRAVWADIDPMTGNISADDVARKCTPRTKAILAVHWGGYPCDLEALAAVARHLRVLGVDVDPACVDWCREHLGAAEFLQGPLHPPLALDTASVNFVLAIELMQHLGETNGLQWLAEWVRICKPGGYLLVSVAADLALTRARLSEAHYAAIQGYEFLELSRNPDLDGVIEDSDYYKNVLHTHAYIRRVWPTCGVEVLRIVPGCIGNHHDLVVLRCLGPVASV